ncbi:radical SAM protein [Candidatus Woesearchaeota archaeon]|nr:radical SAM protein [Candidatus Woesearchaeota archaeon]
MSKEKREEKLINSLKSLSLFVGTGQCNAHCAHCAGRAHRKYAPTEDGIINRDLIYNTIKSCYGQGARSLSISSSGEPTLSPLAVTTVLQLIHECRKEGIEYSPINLYSNGIRIGKDKKFCDTYLPKWKSYGLTTIYVTIHDVDEEKNAKIYGVESYPNLEVVVSRIHYANLLMRGNLVLSRKTIGTFEQFVSTADYLRKIGVDCISAWPVRGADDKVDSRLSPLESELDKIENWVENNQGDGFIVKLLTEKSRIMYQTGQKLTLFPDGTLSNTWCN